MSYSKDVEMDKISDKENIEYLRKLRKNNPNLRDMLMTVEQFKKHIKKINDGKNENTI